MGGGNGQKSKMAREKNLEKQKAAAKGSQLESNKKAMTIQIVCYCSDCVEYGDKRRLATCWNLVTKFYLLCFSFGPAQQPFLNTKSSTL
ncbi:hypothetical protein CRYUN_Cryun04dG0062100 [Craigia yunnanensis]